MTGVLASKCVADSVGDVGQKDWRSGSEGWRSGSAQSMRARGAAITNVLALVTHRLPSRSLIVGEPYPPVAIL